MNTQLRNPVISKAMLLLMLNEASLENLFTIVMPKTGKAYNVKFDMKQVKDLSPEVMRAITVLIGTCHEKFRPPIGYTKTVNSRYGDMTLDRMEEDGYIFSFKPKKTLHVTSDPMFACL